MRKDLTIQNQRLLDLYKIPIDTNSNSVANLFIQQEVDRRVNLAIKKAKDGVFNRVQKSSQ